MAHFELTDWQWERLEPLLPPETPPVGRPNYDHRTIINGILWVLRTGAPWRDLISCLRTQVPPVLLHYPVHAKNVE
jgi:transposase